MKNFRSSKNLRPIEGSVGKEESTLRLKVRQLEEQVQMLQKSNLNIFIPLSEQKDVPNHEAIIAKLRAQVLSLQQQNQGLKTSLKQCEKEKELQLISQRKEVGELKEKIRQLNETVSGFKEQIDELQEEVEQHKEKYREKQKEAIELSVEVRFLKEDVESWKERNEQTRLKYDELQQCVAAVKFNSRIYKSKSTAVTAIETQELQRLNDIISELQARIRMMEAANRHEKVMLGVPKQHLGEEIVRLKKNLDMQLGLESNTNSTTSFLKAYHKTEDTFSQLLSDCKK